MVVLTNKDGYLSCIFVHWTLAAERGYKECVKCPSRNMTDWVVEWVSSLVYWAWQRSDHPPWIAYPFPVKFLSLHAITFTTPNYSRLLWRHPTHCPHAFSLKSIEERGTQCESEMVSFSFNWDNLSKVKITISFLQCCECWFNISFSKASD